MAQKIMRKGISFLLALTLLISGMATNRPLTVNAAMVTQTHYKFIIACVFTWGDTAKGTWDPATPGGSVTKDTRTEIPNNAKNIKIYQYNPNTLDLNKLENLDSWYTANDYINKYSDAAVKKVDISTTGRVSNNMLSYSWTTTLNANVGALNVKKYLEDGRENYIKDLMGGYPDNMQGFLDSREGGKFGDTIEGWLYFVPYIIQYDLEEDIPVTDLEVKLTLPAKAKVGENYVVADASLIPDGATVRETKLQKSLDEGKTWTTINGWNGKSKTESSAVTGDILYRLMIILNDGRSGSDTKSILIYDGEEEEEEEDPDVDAEAVLSLPATTYEGHPVIADDNSVFWVDGESYSSTRVYAEGLASNRFSIVENNAGTISKISGYSTRATAKFPTKGNYNIQLRVAPKGGGYLYDTKPIEVLKTPTILATLTGVQKQNRKQTLNIQVATNPDNPLKELWVELENMDTGEVVHLIHNLDGASNQLDNSENIKTRPITALASDEYWTNAELDFLTRDNIVTSYTYRIFARDSRDLTDEVEVGFTVVPDAPPVAAIEMDSSFLRGSGSDVAVLAAKDISTTDGDQLERTWSVAWPDDNDEFEDITYHSLKDQPGYGDNSFGVGQSVEWEKEGVGQIQLYLHVKDVWTEETLPEYISDDDYLTDTTTAITEVQNVAPVVTLEPIKARSAQVVLLGGSEKETQKLKSTVNSMQEVLLQYAVDADVRVDSLTPIASNISSGTDQSLTKLWSNSTSQGFQAKSTFWEEENYMLDDTTVYRVEGTWKGYDSDYYAELPYSIRAYDGATGTQSWSYTINDLALTSDISLAQDDTNKYFFYRYGAGKTLVLDKQTGAALTTLSMQVGDYSTATDKFIYTFLTDGIYRISLSNGKAERIYQGTIRGEARMIAGKSHFLAINGRNLYRGIFDARTEHVTFHRLHGNEEDPSTMSYESIGIDTAGKLIVRGQLTDNSAYVYYYDKDNVMLARIAIDSTAAAMPVYDEGGVSNYVAYSHKRTSGSGTSKKYYTYVYVCGMDGSKLSYNYAGRNGYPSVANEILFARQFGQYVYVANGASWIWVYGNSYGYPERLTVAEFNLNTGSVGEGSRGPLTSTEEYGIASDTMIVTKIGDNNQYGGEDVITALAWEQNIETILLRYLNRYFGDENIDMKVLGLYDSTNTVSGSSVSSLAKKLQDLGIDLYYVTDMDGSAGTYGSRLVESTSGRQFYDPDTFTRDIGTDMIEQEEEGSWILQLMTNQAADALTREFRLDPSVEYFYEYDIKSEQDAVQDILTVTPEYTKTLDDNLLISGEKYMVTESYLEDFNDDDLNAFFNYKTAVIKDGELQTAYNTDYPGTSETITFTVPEGKTAVVSFDYNLRRYTSQAWNGNYINIDGARWEELAPNGAGHYTHPRLLEAGEHTILVYAAAYRRKASDTEYAYTYLDNLRVDFVEKAPDDSDPAETLQTASSSVQLSNGWNRISGSFTAPNQISAYTRQDAQFLSGDPKQLDFVDYSRSTRMEVTIPKGETAIQYNMAVSLSGGSSADFSLGSTYKWTYYNPVNIGTSQGARYVTGIPSKYTLTLREQTGTLNFGFQDNSQSSSRATHIEMVLAKPNTLTKNNLCFFDDEKLYVANEGYSGSAAVSLKPQAAGNYQIQNLKIYTIQNGAKVYLYDQPFRSDTVTRWDTVGSAQIAVLKDEIGEEEQVGLVYRKDELVTYGISYYDYEADPSKKSFWRYTHMPFNDGEHPDAAVILDELGNAAKITDKVLDAPIDRFYIDGKYIVEHWQEDDTTRGTVPGGNPNYDKASNVESITFYVQGTGEAPWITSIRTVPGTVKEGDNFKIQVGVDDKEKDELSLVTEVYKEGKLLYTHRKEGLNADTSGNYPYTVTDSIPELAQAGRYEVVCTVRDWSGVGLDSYTFSVVSEGGIAGMVQHTENWDQNRKKYNSKQFGTEVNYVVSFSSYKNQAAPRKRGTNVFWSGEAFVLEAGVKGNPTKVTCQILGTSYSTTMTATGNQNAQGEMIYKGTLWDESMINKWGRTSPEELTFRFTATYSGGSTKEDEATVIVDTFDNYWNLHRYF